MALRYYDQALGRDRFKPRYKWAMAAFSVGLLFGIIFAHII
jgi:hypothetical protein